MKKSLSSSNSGCFNKLQEKFQFLFEGELIDEICNHGILKTCKKGSTLIEIGQVVTHMPVIINGVIKVMKEDENDNELLLYYLEVGDTCAATLNCCTRHTRSNIKAIAESNAEIIFIPVEKIEDWMVKYHSWRNYILESYNFRISELLDAVDNLAFNNMEERLYRHLRDKVMISKDAKLKITHQEIAVDLNSSRVVISRLMKKLENEGQIIQHRNYVEVREFMKEKH